MGLLGIFILVVFAVLIGIAINAMWIRGAIGAPAQKPGTYVCGKCGYPAHGISSFECPECGADLREVGIVAPGRKSAALVGCLVPLGFTVVVFAAAILLFILLAQFLPTYSQRDATFSLNPASGQYTQVEVETDFTTVTPANALNAWSGFSSNTLPGPPPAVQLSLSAQGSSIDVHRLRIRVVPASSSGVAKFSQPFMIDVQTGRASWADKQGQSQATPGPFVENDVLAYLGQAGADTNSPDVQLEAAQLYTLLEGMLQGTSQYTLQGFSSGGYGTGASGSVGPPWFFPSYLAAWILIWIVGLVIIFRRGSHRARK